MLHRNVRKRSVTVPVIPVIYRTGRLQEVDKAGRLTAHRQEAFNGVKLFCMEESALIKQRKIYKTPVKTGIMYWYFVSRRRKKKIANDLAPRSQTFGVQKYWVIRSKDL